MEPPHASSPSTRPTASARAALGELIDYAGLFPPAGLGMAQAVAEYLRARSDAHAWMLGRFIVPSSRAGELRAALAAQTTPLPLCVIVDTDRDPRAWTASAAAVLEALATLRTSAPELRIEAIEAVLPPLLARRETYDAAIGQLAALRERTGLRDVPLCAEAPRDARWRDELPAFFAALSRYGLGGKVRCGGVSRDTFAHPSELAAFVAAATEHRVPFKATAGLHHAVRRVDAATGFPMHGFLNLIAATLVARSGEPAAALSRVLADEESSAFGFLPDTFAWREHRFSIEEIAAMRAGGFVAYGSCSFTEPVDDLVALHALDACA